MTPASRVAALTRIALGGILLGRPTLPARLVRAPATSRAVALTRLLGLRYLGQGGIALGVPHDPRVDAGIEAIHAASMLPLAYAERRHAGHARLALLSAGVAAALAAADRREQRTP